MLIHNKTNFYFLKFINFLMNKNITINKDKKIDVIIYNIYNKILNE